MAIAPNQTQPILDIHGMMSSVFRTWTQQVTRAVVLVGTGTPETFVEGFQGQLYMDDAGSAGTILYVKKQADIGGDRKQGWILV